MILISKHPFLAYALAVLLVKLLVVLSGAQYDDGGIGGVLIASSAIWGVIYWIPSELMFMLNSGVAIKGHDLISIIIAIVFCVFLDSILNLYRRRKRGQLASK